MTVPQYPERFLALLRSVRGKRARIVIDHILQHGYITTEDLERYGYKHPPRAARDVRDNGVPLETFSAKNEDGRTITAYRFGNPAEARYGRLGGRRILSRQLKQELIRRFGSRCAVCLQDYEDRYLQIDHRVPYEVACDTGEVDPSDFMLICGSCNRAKSWSCEHCANWTEEKDPAVCLSCYWVQPDSYRHIALRLIRRLDVVWSGREVEVYEKLRERTEQISQTLPDYVKEVLRQHLDDTGT